MDKYIQYFIQAGHLILAKKITIAAAMVYTFT